MGDFHPIARSYAADTGEFVARLSLQPGTTLLDLGCGTGGLSIPAAQAGARVTGIDISPNAIARARQEARAAGASIAFEVGDAESLCLPDQEFTVTASMFGAMFAGRPERAVTEMLRVTRPGGWIAMANWTAEGWVGAMRDVHTTFAPPPGDLPSPFDWGEPWIVRERFGGRVSALTCVRRAIELRFDLPPAAVTEVFAMSYGPMVATLRAAAPEEASRMRSQITQLFTEHNCGRNDTTVLVGEYLDVLARVA